MTITSPAVFVARDSWQRKSLLWILRIALDAGDAFDHVYGHKATNVAVRARARQRRRGKARR